MTPPIDFAGLFRTSPNPYVLVDSNLVIREMNAAYLAATQRTRDEIIGRAMFDAFPSDPASSSYRQLRSSLERAVTTGTVDHLSLIRYDIASPDGTMTERYWSATHTPLHDAHGQVAYVLQHTVDVTELHQLRRIASSGRDDALQTGVVKRAEAVQATNLVLGQALEQLQTLFDQAPGFMAVLTGPDYVFSLANRAYVRVIGNRDVVGKPLRQVLPEIEAQGFIGLLDRVCVTGEPFIGRQVPIALVPEGGTTPFERVLDFIYQPIVDIGGKVTGVFVQGHDVTDQTVAERELRQLADTLELRVSSEVAERQQAELALQQAQRMEALGQLTGGVAHDFNNLLQVVASNLYLLEREVPGQGRAAARFEAAQSAVARGGRLARQLLAFARKQPLEPQVVDLGVLVAGLGDMLNQALGEAVEIETVVQDGLWNTLVDPVQIENVLLNLAINARDAMDGAGRLAITLGNVGDQRGEFVQVAVSDTGHGMTPEVLDKAFEPFFTTKPDGKGTGLGLSMVYGFVRQSGGHIDIDSVPGRGTTVTLLLPRTDAPVSAQPRAAVEADTGHGEGVVLVAEDDDAVRETAMEMLAQHGYRTIGARDGAEVLAVIESGQAVDLVFSDVIMPGPVRSPEMARRVRELRPGLPILFTSGYTQDIAVGSGGLGEGIELLGKPYSQALLIRKVAEAMRTAPQTQKQYAARKLSVAVVEDDPLIRMSVVDMVEILGHAVIECGSGEEALAQLSGVAVDVLVTDIGLPGMSGTELARQLRERLPHVGVVLATGASTGLHDAGSVGMTVLSKPFDERGLAEAIAAVTGR